MNMTKSESRIATRPAATEGPSLGLIESETIQRAQGGDAAAFEYLYNSYSRQVNSVCLRMLKNASHIRSLSKGPLCCNWNPRINDEHKTYP